MPAVQSTFRRDCLWDTPNFSTTYTESPCQLHWLCNLSCLLVFVVSASEICWYQVVQRAVRTVVIVLLPPVFHNSLCLPQAKVVADKFRLIRPINRALDKMRTRLQGGNRRGERQDLFKSRYTLLKGAERLVNWEKARLNELFYCYPELRRVQVLYQHDIMADGSSSGLVNYVTTSTCTYSYTVDSYGTVCQYDY